MRFRIGNFITSKRKFMPHKGNVYEIFLYFRNWLIQFIYIYDGYIKNLLTSVK